MQRIIALTCEALARSMYALAAQSPHTISIRLYRQGLHNTPKVLHRTLQEQIDDIQPGECDAILLVYGLCGMSTVGLVARHTPLVIPRTHDCIALYLGSSTRTPAPTGTASISWSAASRDRMPGWARPTWARWTTCTRNTSRNMARTTPIT